MSTGEKKIKQNSGDCVIVLEGATSLEEEGGQGPVGGALQLSGFPCVPGAEGGSWSGGVSRKSLGKWLVLQLAVFQS